MKMITKRGIFLWILCALFLIGLGFLTFSLVTEGSVWVMKPYNRHVYSHGQLIAAGDVKDVNGVVLSKTEDGERVYNDDKTIRMATLHAVGDPKGFISNGAQTAFKSQLVGYNIVTGVYSIERYGSGNDLTLTIDSEINRIAYNALGDYKGTIAVANYKTGDIVCMVSTPSYDVNKVPSDLETNEKYEGVYINRFLTGLYTPGSTFKLSVALAGLEEGVITKDTRFVCNHIYSAFKDTQFKCLGYHGSISVAEALNQSCNIFFYETGRQLGIEKMNDYCSRLGLGQKTGVEISESTGVLASISYREAHGGTWSPGDTVQAAIGQSDNLFTPIQLCNYVATIANGGTRYKAHFVKSVKSADFSETVIDSTPIVLNETGISQQSINTVKEGMMRYGARVPALSALPMSVAAKSGTAESKAKVNGKIESGLNGFMVSFAPADKPEIAVCVAIENLNSGTATAALVADIYRAYFGVTSEVNQSSAYNTLLN